MFQSDILSAGLVDAKRAIVSIYPQGIIINTSSKLKGVKMKTIVSIKVVEKWVVINGRKETRYNVYVNDCLVGGDFMTINEARNFISGYVLKEDFSVLIKRHSVGATLEGKKNKGGTVDFGM